MTLINRGEGMVFVFAVVIFVVVLLRCVLLCFGSFEVLAHFDQRINSDREQSAI